MVFKVGVNINKMVKFGSFGRILFPNQHVVIKVFSELRKENHILEKMIFDSMDRDK